MNVTEPSPIILLHRGANDYLGLCIRVLRVVHNCDVTLLGDSSNVEIALKWGARHVDIEKYRDKKWEDEKLGYVHNSSLPLEFEKFCFVRFKILFNYVVAASIDRFIYLDSDIVILNRNILENFTSILPYVDIASLSNQSTFFSGWKTHALGDFITSFPSYFCGEAWGNRHCDMFAFSRFLSSRAPETVRSNLILGTPVYDRLIYGQDPNFSFAPFIMKWSNIWGYRELQKMLPDISGLIKIKSGVFYLQFTGSNLAHRLDFLHLNGFLKSYIPHIELVIFGSSVVSQQ